MYCDEWRPPIPYSEERFGSLVQSLGKWCPTLVKVEWCHTKPNACCGWEDETLTYRINQCLPVRFSLRGKLVSLPARNRDPASNDSLVAWFNGESAPPRLPRLYLSSPFF
ncbi:hypothetical protein M407DRAFT_34698 [Tulasnella calospora MUT 4182]|uniref:Uncharacterized protein n=1 Tax=Tulasnella calospora MUT 4182 TaxID=1051891 RepID=A0A0C3L1W0_9AGAM|nr:hypothetical protein M407DRAFT_34698 [Tulasnella calospora MUT 4182]